jgi:biotin synthesis protein BioG
MTNRPERSLASVREELTCLRDHVGNCGEVPDIFDRRIVTTRDRIFPSRNQVRSWGKQKCRLKKWPHFPFYSEQFP